MHQKKYIALFLFIVLTSDHQTFAVNLRSDGMSLGVSIMKELLMKLSYYIHRSYGKKVFNTHGNRTRDARSSASTTRPRLRSFFSLFQLCQIFIVLTVVTQYILKPILHTHTHTHTHTDKDTDTHTHTLCLRSFRLRQIQKPVA